MVVAQPGELDMSLQTHRFVLPYYVLNVSLIGLIASLIAGVPAAIALSVAAVALSGTVSLITYRRLRAQEVPTSQTGPGPGPRPDAEHRNDRLVTHPVLGWLAGVAAGLATLRLLGQPLWFCIAIPVLSVTVYFGMQWWVDRGNPP